MRQLSPLMVCGPSARGIEAFSHPPMGIMRWESKHEEASRPGQRDGLAAYIPFHVASIGYLYVVVGAYLRSRSSALFPPQ